MSSAPEVPLIQLTGPMLIGLCLNWGLFGCAMVQLYYYHCFFPKDNWLVKTLVYTLYLWDFAQTIMFTQDWFNIFAINFGNESTLQAIGTTWFSVPFMDGISSPIIQCFYAWRVYRLSKCYYLSGLIILIALMQGAASISLGVIMGFKLNAFSELHAKSAAVTTVWLVGSAVCDILICTCMLFYLQRARSLISYTATGNFIERIIRLTLGAGLLTALVSITDITLFLVFSRNNYHMAPAIIIGKLQFNSFLVLMNSRRRQEADDSVYEWDAESGGRNQTGAFRRVSVALDVGPSRTVRDNTIRFSTLDSPVFGKSPAGSVRKAMPSVDSPVHSPV